MAAPRRPLHRHFRGGPRPGRQVEVHYRVLDGGDAGEEGPELAGSTRNLGIGGAFINTDEPEPLGTRLSLILRVPGGDPLSLRGEVRWIDDDEEEGSPRGMGVRFTTLTAAEIVALNEYFAQLSEAFEVGPTDPGPTR